VSGVSGYFALAEARPRFRPHGRRHVTHTTDHHACMPMAFLFTSTEPSRRSEAGSGERLGHPLPVAAPSSPHSYPCSPAISRLPSLHGINFTVLVAGGGTTKGERSNSVNR